MARQRVLLIASALGLATVSHPALAGSRTTAQVLYSENAEERAFQESAGFSDAVILHDGTIYLSGIVVGPDADEAAFNRAYRRISDILIRAGSSWEDVVDVTSYHTDIDKQIGPMSAVQKQYLAPPFPAWTAIQVTRLYLPEGRTEIKVVAKRAPR
ncbi:Rid family hydrolase [Blastomonas sp.]|uniref:Rid family hydrolase n=1 Tax=Blastomonas sp. TaxID=1909299 RepID=UPI00262AF564|nr:Rid family hydrolase [Blastomonas sp.]MDM7954942.1 Rid family hydrolase [Blastomonas sp.]